MKPNITMTKHCKQSYLQRDTNHDMFNRVYLFDSLLTMLK